ncbi:MAG TPA: c-type cytochrome, partial [Chthoniobacteraceae bacterium]|nr:c-type cytochrome [Chthoniobacteraceae bacterium]
ALLASVGNSAAELFASTAAQNPGFARELAVIIGVRNRNAEVDAALAHALAAKAPAEWLTPLADGLARAGSSLASGTRAERLLPLVASATERVRLGKDAHAGDFALLGLSKTNDAPEIITTAMLSGLDATNCDAALAALRSLKPPNLGKLLGRAWQKIPVASRPAALQLWRSRPQQIPTLLDAIESGTVAKSDLSADDLATLRSTKDPAVKARAVALLGEVASREKVLASFRPALEMQGDAAKGRTTFTARCAVCHRFRGEGTAVGPDLDASNSAGREKVLGNIIEPSREITAGFQMATAETKGGEVVAGVLVAETEGAITLRQPGGQLRNVPMIEVARVDRTSRSLMPEGIEAGLSPQDMADLLAFLTSH